IGGHAVLLLLASPSLGSESRSSLTLPSIRRPRDHWTMVDYAALDSAVGHNWYDADPEVQARVRADCPDADLEWADGKLRSFGQLVGDRIARNADIIDAAPPQLVRWDRWANEVNEVVHHPATLDSKRSLWEAGYVSGFAADEGQRGRPTPAVVLAASNY